MRRIGTRSPCCSTYPFEELGKPAMGVTETLSTTGSCLLIFSPYAGIIRIRAWGRTSPCLSASAREAPPVMWMVGGPYPSSGLASRLGELLDVDEQLGE